jgi:hypothetical protein
MLEGSDRSGGLEYRKWEGDSGGVRGREFWAGLKKAVTQEEVKKNALHEEDLTGLQRGRVESMHKSGKNMTGYMLLQTNSSKRSGKPS